MSLSAKEFQAIEDLTDLLYEFLPASGNSSTSFPIAAAKAGVGDLWHLEYAKRPAISDLLTRVVSQRRARLPSLMVCVVRQSITWRRKKANPLTRSEVEQLNDLMLLLGFRVKDLSDPAFLASLAGSHSTKPDSTPSPSSAPPDVPVDDLRNELLAISKLAPQPRGYAFEKFLGKLFAAYDLSPRSAFRLVGEQIDGSFDLAGTSYLVEAKWQNSLAQIQDLLAFSGKVEGKAVWARGVFVSYAGFSEDSLVAFSRGRRTNIICIDGLDLHECLSGNISVRALISAKLRRATETNRAYTPFRELSL